MATYNGENFLKAQLDSLIEQKEVHVKILISDDGSSDNTLEIIEFYQEKFGHENE